MKNNEVRICEKYSLTITEAVAYFGIGEKKLRNMIERYSHENWFYLNGVKYMIRREMFETFLNGMTTI